MAPHRACQLKAPRCVAALGAEKPRVRPPRGCWGVIQCGWSVSVPPEPRPPTTAALATRICTTRIVSSVPLMKLGTHSPARSTPTFPCRGDRAPLRHARAPRPLIGDIELPCPSAEKAEGALECASSGKGTTCVLKKTSGDRQGPVPRGRKECSGDAPCFARAPFEEMSRQFGFSCPGSRSISSPKSADGRGRRQT